MGKPHVAHNPPADRRLDILKFILKFTIRNHYPPTFREIGHGVGLSGPGHVHYYLHSMRRDGQIKFDDGYSRTIIVVNSDALIQDVLKEMAA